MIKKLIITIFTLLLLLNSVFALSVSPAGKNIDGEPGETVSFSFTVDSKTPYEISIPSEFSNYITIQEGVFDERQTFQGQLTIPENIERLKIDIVERSEATGQVTAKVSTPYFLFVKQTVEGKMITYNIRHSQTNSKINGATMFNIENIGSEIINEVTINVRINNEEVTNTISNLQPKETRQTQIRTPPTNLGPTTLNYEINYDGNIITNTQNIVIGRPNLILNDINLNYQKNQTNVIRASFTSNWPNKVTQDIQMTLQNQQYTVQNANLDTTTYEFFYDDSQIPLGNHTLTFGIQNNQIELDYIKTENNAIIKEKQEKNNSQNKIILYVILAILAIILLISIIIAQKKGE